MDSLELKDGGIVILLYFILPFTHLIRKKSFLSLIYIFLAFSSTSLSAAVIQFPDQELASEYVMPVFKNTKVILNRNITLSKRIEWRISGAFRTDEPFYNPLSAFTSLSFYWNEFHSIGLSGLYFFPGLSRTGNKLNDEKEGGVPVKCPPGALQCAEGRRTFNAGLAPHPLLAGFLNYQFSPLYGKISITKTIVLSFALYSFFGGGAIWLQHGAAPLVMVPAINFGVGQRFYFNRYFALDGGIDFLMYRGPNAVLEKMVQLPGKKAPARPEYTEFKQEILLRFLVRFGITILI